MSANRTYYAMSTENAQMCGWTVLGVADTKQHAEEEAYRNLSAFREGGVAHTPSFRDETWRKNLIVMSKSQAERRGFVRKGTWPVFDEEQAVYHMEF